MCTNHCKCACHQRWNCKCAKYYYTQLPTIMQLAQHSSSTNYLHTHTNQIYFHMEVFLYHWNTCSCILTIASVHVIRVQNVSIITVAQVTANSVVAVLRTVVSVFSTFIDIWNYKKLYSKVRFNTCKVLNTHLPKHFALAKP